MKTGHSAVILMPQVMRLNMIDVEYNCTIMFRLEVIEFKKFHVDFTFIRRFLDNKWRFLYALWQHL